jgi:hypothetical protein
VLAAPRRTPPGTPAADAMTPPPSPAAPQPPAARGGASPLAEGLFAMFADQLAAGDYNGAATLLEKLALSPTAGVASFAASLPAFTKAVDAARRKDGGPDSGLHREWAAVACLVAAVNHTEHAVLRERPAAWRELLCDACAMMNTALRCFVDLFGRRGAGDRQRDPPCALVAVMLHRYRSLYDRCGDAGLAALPPSQLKAACSKLYGMMMRLLGNNVKGEGNPPAATVAMARLIAEMIPNEELSLLLQHVDFVEWFDGRFPKEVVARVALHYRFGHRLLQQVVAVEQAHRHLQTAFALARSHAVRVDAFEPLCVAQLLLGNAPTDDAMARYAAPALEDFVLALRSANLRVFEAALERNALYLLRAGLLPPVSSLRPLVVLNMLVKFFMQHCRASTHIALDAFRAANAGQFADGEDIALAYVLPLLLEHQLNGYVSDGTLVLSRKAPFSGIDVKLLFPGDDGTPNSPPPAGSAAASPPPPGALTV